MPKDIFFKDEGRNKMKIGIDKAADAIKGTMGAAGRNVFIWKQFGAPQSTNDGYTIAKSITLFDPTENMGAELIKEVAEKTVKECGDGTSCASLLTQSIINTGLEKIQSGVNVMNLSKGIKMAVSSVVKRIKELSTPVTKEKLVEIASISANNDKEIGKKIADAIDKVGKEGIIHVEESKTYETTVEVVEGMQIDSGFISPFFINQEKKPECILHDPYILITDKKINLFPDLIPIIEKCAKESRPLFIIADNVEGPALEGLIINKGRGLMICAVRSPAQRETMDDIAILTKGTFVSTQMNLKLKDVGIDKFGQAKKVVINNNTTTIIGGMGLPENIKLRCETINGNIAEAISDFDKKTLEERLAKLNGGIALLKVGGATASEISEKKDRIDDAVCATKAAMEEGFIAGGGITYLECLAALPKSDVPDEQTGIDIIGQALFHPFEQILLNAGLQPTDYMEKVNRPYGMGVNVSNGLFEDLFKSGVIDPAKVARVALENAASVAALFLTTECVLSEITF